MPQTIQVKVEDYVEAQNGSVLSWNGKYWKATTKAEFLKDINKAIDECKALRDEIIPLRNANNLLKEQNNSLVNEIDELKKAIAYLVYENKVDKGTIVEQEELTLENCLKGENVPQEILNILEMLEGGKQ